MKKTLYVAKICTSPSYEREVAVYEALLTQKNGGGVVTLTNKYPLTTGSGGVMVMEAGKRTAESFCNELHEDASPSHSMLRGIIEGVGKVLLDMHNADWCHNDFKLKQCVGMNMLCTQYRLIDMDSAGRAGVDFMPENFTPIYAAPEVPGPAL